MRMTTVSSGRITTQALISGEPSAARTTSGPNGSCEAEAEPAADRGGADEERAAIDFRHVIHGCLPAHALAAAWIAVAHLLEGAATADIGDVGVDVGVGRLRLVLEQRRHRHDHAALAIAALRHVVFEPGLLHLVQHAVLRQPFDGGDLPAVDRAQRHRARAHRDAVDMDGAGAALRDAAAVFGAGQSDRLPQHPQQRACWGRRRPDESFHSR